MHEGRGGDACSSGVNDDGDPDGDPDPDPDGDPDRYPDRYPDHAPDPDRHPECDRERVGQARREREACRHMWR
jgi:hypothetical protein